MVKTVSLSQRLSAILCGVFLVFLFVRGIGAYRSTIIAAVEQPSLKAAIAAVEERISDRFTGKLPFLIDLQGFLHRVLGKNEVGNFFVVKDRLGMLHFGKRGRAVIGYPSNDNYGELSAFSDFCKKSGIPFICLVTPPRALDAYLPPEITSAEQSEKQKIFRMLASYGIETFPSFPGSDATEEEQLEIFFRTDHHWRIETAFLWYAGFMEYLRTKRGFSFPMYSRDTNLENYAIKRHPAGFLGSIGRRVGRYYTEWDEFSLIIPDFETRISRSINSRKEIGHSFETALIDPRYLEDEKSPINRYAAYLGGDYGENVILNKDGKYRILVIQDSFGLPFSSFLSLSFAETRILDLRHYHEMSVMEYVRKNPDFDIILCINQFFQPGFMNAAP